MPRPSKGYETHDGTKIKGVTTIAKRFEDKSNLIAWANKQGLQGVSIQDVRKLAFQMGSEVHYIFECVIKRRDIKVPEIYEGFVKQLKKVLKDLEIVDVLSEIALISEKYKFGGTPDLIVKTKQDETIIIDFKFSNRLSPSVAYQMGGYKILVEENLPPRKVTRGIAIQLEKKEFNKGNARLAVMTIPEKKLEKFTAAFLEMVKLYPILEGLENEFKQYETVKTV